MSDIVIVLGSEGVRAHLSVGINCHQRLGHLVSNVILYFSRCEDIHRLSSEEVFDVGSCELCCQGNMRLRSHAPVMRIDHYAKDGSSPLGPDRPDTRQVDAWGVHMHKLGLRST